MTIAFILINLVPKKLLMSYRLFAMSSFADLYPERRGGSVSPSVLQRATGTATVCISVVYPDPGGAVINLPPRSRSRILFFALSKTQEFLEKISIFYNNSVIYYLTNKAKNRKN
jgi:hypothetical protein